MHTGPFSDMLAKINPVDISPDPYVSSYFRHLLEHRSYYLHIYRLVLERLSDRSCLLDCGAGNGLLGIFAKYCGWEKVILNDISGNFLDSARVISEQLGIIPDRFILGDLPETYPVIQHEGIRAVVGTDVIEHVYDLPSFLGAARRLEAGSLVFTTASNVKNRWKAKAIRKVQVADEQNEFESKRYRLIREAQLDFSPAEVRILARLTRGMRREDILSAALVYLRCGQLPIPPEHPTNTCDPDTGSWTERLLSFKEYAQLFSGAGYDLSIENGFYNSFEPGTRAILLGLANQVILLNRRLGYQLSPYILLDARRREF